MRRLTRIRPAALLPAAAVLAFALQLFSDNKADVDLWGNVGFVTAMPWQEGFHRENTFSFTEPGHPWVNHEWLAEYILHHTHRLAGNPGLLLLKIALGLATLALMQAALARHGTSPPVRLFLLLLLISTMGYGFSTRPHLFTYLLLAVFLTLLERPASAAVHLLVLPVLMLLWANLHGAFFVGLLVLLVHLAAAAHGRRGLRLAAAGLLLAAAATLVNPYGPTLWSFVSESAGRSRTYLSEWAPFNLLQHGLIHPDFLVLAAAGTACLVADRRRQTGGAGAYPAVLFALALAAALAMRRNIPLLAITAAFTLGGPVERVTGPVLRRVTARLQPAWQHGLAAAFAVLALAYAVLFNKQNPAQIEVPADRYPLRTVAFMRANAVRGNCFAFFDWAEYGIWHLYPACRVFMDGRFLSAYSHRVIDDYLGALYGAPDWKRVLDTYGVDLVLTHPGNPLTERVNQDPDWALAFAEDSAVLHVRREAHRPLIERLAAGNTPPAPDPGPYFP